MWTLLQWLKDFLERNFNLVIGVILSYTILLLYCVFEPYAMSRKSLCWDTVTSEVVALNSRGDVVQIDLTSSDEDVPKRNTKNKKGARRKLSSSDSSSEHCFRTPSKNNRFRIRSDDSSDSDDCVVYSSEDEKSSFVPSKVKELTLPKFSYETPDKKTLQKNKKLLCDISNQCGTPLKSLDRLIADATVDFSNLSCNGLGARKSKGVVQRRSKESKRKSGETRVDSDKLFDALIGINDRDDASKENRILDESIPNHSGNFSKVKIMEGDSYLNVLQAFDDVILPKTTSIGGGGANKISHVPVKTSGKQNGSFKKTSSIKSVSSEEPLDSFFKKPTTFKKQKEVSNKVKRPGDSKIVHRRTDDSDSTDGASVENHQIWPSLETLNIKVDDPQMTSTKLPKPPVPWEREPVLISSDPDDIYAHASPKPPLRKRGKTTAFSFKDLESALGNIEKNSISGAGREVLSFLSSLDDLPDGRSCHPTASFYKEKFAKKKEELTAVLYKMFNKDVFESKLPDDMTLEWSGRMTSSAGITHLSRKIVSGEWNFLARITLSKPIVTTAARLRDTLIHEMCHAAVWLLDRKKDGHGSFWKAWTYKARESFPELRPINTCHSYSRDWKFHWECVSCGYTIGRMTKSFNTERFSCGRCHGRFLLKENPNKKKREASGFAKFVKDNYASVKIQGTGHKDVMKLLSQKYQNQNQNDPGNKQALEPDLEDDFDDDCVILSDE